jgi:RNA polymerase sigma-70 factor (ECF subfamily)
MSAVGPTASRLQASDPVADDRSTRRLRRRSEIRAASDEALVAGMATRDFRAAEVFVQRHEQRVFGIAMAIASDRATAEDVAQEAFLRAWLHAAVFDPRRASAQAWLSTITRNLAIDALRLQRATAVDPNDAIWLESDSRAVTTEDQTERSMAVDRVRHALSRVPVAQRRVLVRSAFYGQSAAEIADAEAIPIGTAKSRIRLGLSKVRDILDGVDG